MMNELEQLKQHVMDFENDGSMEMVTALQRRLEIAIAGEKLADHLVIVEFRKGLETEIEAIDLLLKTQPSAKLSATERDYLIAKKGLYERFFDAFGGKARRESIEQTIKNYLAHVRTQ